MPEISLSWLGPIAATIDGRPIKFRTRRAQALLMYLTTESALQGGPPTRRETLLGLLWPDYIERSARQSLRTNLSYLKKGLVTLEEEEGDKTSFLLSDSQNVQLNPAVPFDLDVATFSRLLKECEAHQHETLLACTQCQERLERAVHLYRGEFLADFFLPDGNEFEAWVSARREALRRQMLDALEVLTGGCLAGAQFEAAERYARRQLEIDPIRESAHQQLIQVLARMGRRPAALSQFESFKTMLRDELDIEPSPESQRLSEAIRLGELETKVKGQVSEEKEESEMETGEEVIAAQPSPSMVSRPQLVHNLPVQPTPFIGREEELAALGEMIADPELRLVTIVGTGGMGKTRLALAAAERLALPERGHETRPYRFADGIYFVSLAPLSKQDQIVPAIAETLGIKLQPGALKPQQQLLSYLRQKQLLLVLDNFEQLLEAAETLGDLVQGAPQVQFLVTSLERLHLLEEQVFTIQGLEVVNWQEDEMPAVEEALDYPAARLFMQSARRLQHDLTITVDESLEVARICRLVEGMPLAIELAASWVDTLPLANIAAEIQQGLDFLETEWRHVPRRHRCMRATIDRSWHRLSQLEQGTFSRLSVFRGGFTRRAAQQVAGSTLRALSSLVGKSFLHFDKSSDRYQVHELLRQYGSERLAEAPEREEKAQDRHTVTYMAFLVEQESRLKGAEVKGAMEAIRADIDNVRHAWRRVVAEGHEEKMGQAALGLFLFYQFRGWHQEAEEAFRQAVSLLENHFPGKEWAGELTTSCFMLAQVLDYHGYFLVRMGHLEQALEVLEKSLTILRLAPDETKWETAHCLIHYGGVFHVTSQFGQALSLYQESEALFREIGDPWGRALALGESAQIHHLTGHYDEGKRLYQQSQILLESIGERRFLVFILSNLARIAYIQGAYQEAETGHLHCLQLRKEMRDMEGVAFTLTDLGDAARVQRNLAGAEQHYRQSLALSTDIALSDGKRLALLGLSKVANERREYKIAKTWQQEGLALAQEAGYLPWQLHLEAGRSGIGIGDHDVAKRSFQDALKLVHSEQIAWGATTAVAGLATLEAEKGNKVNAIEWLALSSNHPAAYADEKGRYRQLMGELSAGLSAEAVTAAEERGRALDLWQMVEDLLEDQ